MQEIENNEMEFDNLVITNTCEICHREYEENEFTIQSDRPLCEECYRAELAKNQQ